MVVAQKELMNQLEKGKQPLGSLLNTEGLEMFRVVCMENLHLVASNDENTQVFNQLMVELRENECIVKDTAKHQSDLKTHFNDERSTLKQQVVNRILRDFVNSTPETGSALHQARSYLTSHIGRLSPKCNLVLHHLAYLHARYLNTRLTP